jgi:hypothetical protein
MKKPDSRKDREGRKGKHLANLAVVAAGVSACRFSIHFRLPWFVVQKFRIRRRGRLLLLAQKNPPANRRAIQAGKRVGASDGNFRNFRIKVDGVRVVAFDAMKLVAALEHSIELVDEQRDGLVALIRLHDGIHVGALDLNMALGLELHADRWIPVAFQFHADAHDALLVTEQSLGFLTDERLQ